jgi:glucose-6-phosphate isomerase
VWYNVRVQLTLSNDRPSCAELAARFGREKVLRKLEAIDAKARRKGLHALDARRNLLVSIGMETDAKGAVTKNSYGVFHLGWLAGKRPEWSAMVRAEVEEIREGIRARHGTSLKFLVWAGMGGSAEDKSMYNACGLLKKGPRCYVLDSTDPAKLKAILADMTARSGGRLAAALKSTLVVGMAMGMTSFEPVVNLEKLAKLYERHGIDSRPNFLYMTFPGSLLDEFAGPRGYRRVELQLDGGNSTAGRHSGPLTRGSLYPLALAGVDLEAWIGGAKLEDEEVATAWKLSAFLEAQAEAGRDKVTLLLSKPLAGAALWTKQDFEESLGKSEERGIKIVIGVMPRLARFRSPRDARQDRVFVAVERKGEPGVDRRKLAALKRSGYPLARLTLENDAPLSRYMQSIHFAVFGLAWLRRMNFVTQPSVELYKAITKPIYEYSRVAGGIDKVPDWQKMKATPRQAKWRNRVTLNYGHVPCGEKLEGRDAPSVYAALLKQFADAGAIEYGEITFFGDMRYSARGQALKKKLEKAANQVFRERLRMSVDVYEGPAVNHSYHEMIIGHGRCFSTVLLSEKAESIPEIGYTADYHRAQFLATQMALAQRGRLVVALLLKDLEEPTLDALESFFAEAARQLRS